MTLDHQQALHAALASLVADWPVLQLAPTGQRHGSGSAETSLPGGTDRLVLLVEGTGLLSQWVLLVLEERFADHERGQVKPMGDDVLAWLGFLQRHTPWLGEHDAGAEAATELAELARGVRALVAPSGTRRIPIGACPRDDCTGVVHATLSDDGEGAPDCVCDLEPRDHRWGEVHYGLLAQLLGTPEAPKRGTPTQLAHWLSEQFRRPITEGMVTGWIRRATDKEREALAVDEDGAVDRVQLTMLYLARRSRAAAA